MPYIKQEDRTELEKELYPVNAGELNYCIHILLDRYLKQKGQSYQTYNDMMGALEGAKLELYRRRVSNYEDKKIVENGDIDFYQPTEDITPRQRTHAVVKTTRKGYCDVIVFSGNKQECINYCEAKEYPEEYSSPQTLQWGDTEESVEIVKL